jgi:hypothetical protein
MQISFGRLSLHHWIWQWPESPTPCISWYVTASVTIGYQQCVKTNFPMYLWRRQQPVRAIGDVIYHSGVHLKRKQTSTTFKSHRSTFDQTRTLVLCILIYQAHIARILFGGAQNTTLEFLGQNLHEKHIFQRCTSPQATTLSRPTYETMFVQKFHNCRNCCLYFAGCEDFRTGFILGRCIGNPNITQRCHIKSPFIVTRYCLPQTRIPLEHCCSAPLVYIIASLGEVANNRPLEM